MAETAPALPAVPSTTPAWLVRLVAFVLPLLGVGLDVWNPSHRIDTSAAQAAVVAVFVFVAAIIFVVHIAIEAVHKYGWSKSAAGVFLDESGVELRALISEAKPLVEQARPALDAIGPLSSVVERVGEVEHKLAQSANTVPSVDRALIEASVREVLGSLVPGSGVQPAPTVTEPATAPVTPLEVSPAAGAPVTTVLPGSAPAQS